MRGRKASVGRLPPQRMGDLRVRDVGAAVGAFPGKLSVVSIQLPARGRHEEVLHRRTSELVVITRGSAVGVVGGRRLALRRGDSLYIPPRVRHLFIAGGSGVEALAIFHPALDGEAPDVHPVRRKGS